MTVSNNVAIELKNITKRFGSVVANRDVCLTVKKGEILSILGENGSGKTTLISLAARFYDTTSGTVLIDGKDIKEYTFDALYDRIGYVTQKAVLFAGDIRDNVLFGESAAVPTDENAQKALELAQASEFVEKLPGKLDAPISQGGSNVSGGQKQRLAIARALARNPEILIFDDSFSALDYKTDAALRKGLAEKLGGVTCMIVAQRIGTIRNADKIVIEDGVVSESGTHEELIKNCAVYREIAMSQLSAEELGA